MATSTTDFDAIVIGGGPGVHAAGDMAHVAALPMPMASVLSAAAAGGVAAAAMVQQLL